MWPMWYVFSWTSSDALMFCLYTSMFLSRGHSVFVSLFSPVCPPVLLLLLNYSYFYLTQMKYESLIMMFISPAYTQYLSPACYIHCLCFLFLWFVTRHPSPPTSLRFWSALGWLVIMLMQLCSIKVSAPHPPPPLPHLPPPSATTVSMCLLTTTSLSVGLRDFKSWCQYQYFHCVYSVFYFNTCCSCIQ